MSNPDRHGRTESLMIAESADDNKNEGVDIVHLIFKNEGAIIRRFCGC